MAAFFFHKRELKGIWDLKEGVLSCCRNRHCVRFSNRTDVLVLDSIVLQRVSKRCGVLLSRNYAWSKSCAIKFGHRIGVGPDCVFACLICKRELVEWDRFFRVCDHVVLRRDSNQLIVERLLVGPHAWPHLQGSVDSGVRTSLCIVPRHSNGEVSNVRAYNCDYPIGICRGYLWPWRVVDVHSHWHQLKSRRCVLSPEVGVKNECHHSWPAVNRVVPGVGTWARAGNAWIWARCTACDWRRHINCCCACSLVTSKSSTALCACHYSIIVRIVCANRIAVCRGTRKCWATGLDYDSSKLTRRGTMSISIW